MFLNMLLTGWGPRYRTSSLRHCAGTIYVDGIINKNSTQPVDIKQRQTDEHHNHFTVHLRPCFLSSDN